MKKIILTLCVVLLSMATGHMAQAQDAGELVTIVKINKTDGRVVRYGLPSAPEVTFAGDNLLVTAAEIEALEIPRAEVSHIDFEKNWQSALDAASLGEDDFSFGFDGEEVVLASRKLTRVEMFDTAGHRLMSVAAEDGNARLSLAGLASGVYVVAPDCHPAVKVVKK